MDNNKREKQLYFMDYCKSKGSAVSFYVERILNNKVSKDEENNILRIINSLINDVKDVANKNGITYHHYNDFDSNLYLLEDKKYLFINNYLSECHYYEELELEYLGIINKIEMNQILSLPESKHLELLIRGNKINKEDFELIFNYVLKRVIDKEHAINYDTFKLLTYEYIISLMKKYIDDPICIISKKETEIKRYELTNMNMLTIKESDLIKLYNIGDINILSSIYEQLYYVKRYKEIEINKENDDNTLKELMDAILAMNNSSYYEQNFYKLSYEVNSKHFGLTKLIEKLNDINIEIYKKDLLIKKLKEYQNYLDDDKRCFNNEEYTLKDLFENNIDNYIELINNYPQLDNYRKDIHDRNK